VSSLAAKELQKLAPVLLKINAGSNVVINEHFKLGTEFLSFEKNTSLDFKNSGAAISMSKSQLNGQTPTIRNFGTDDMISIKDISATKLSTHYDSKSGDLALSAGDLSLGKLHFDTARLSKGSFNVVINQAGDTIITRI
jgi:hypothetical protein